MKTKIIFGMLSLIASASFATPLKDAACAKNLRITHPQNSSGIYFSEDCKIAYVLPPAMSEVSVSAIVGTAHARTCGAYNKLVNQYEKNAELLERISEKLQGADDQAEQQGSGLGSELDSLLQPKDKEVDIDEELAKIDRRDELYEKYLELAEKTEKLFKNFENKPAASATLAFKLPWDDLINNYQRANAGIHFVRMPLTNAYLTFNRVISKVGTAPALLDYDITGVGAKDITPAHSNSSTLLVGDAYSGQIMLSMVGACPFYRESTKKLASTLSGQSLTAYLNANMNFEYQLQVYRHYKVSYRLGLFVKKVKERSSSGGFFSTQQHVTEINESKSTDWFDLKNMSNDARFSYELLIPEVKAELMNRAIRDLTMMEGYSAEAAPQVIARTKNGAQASAEALQKCPHQYCQIGALGLQALDAIFGSSKSSSTYINDRMSLVEDEINDNKMITFNGSSTFIPEKRVF